jgi:catechol 2,3-dioxygenase-like lactoylglutathione lyase family enzyme
MGEAGEPCGCLARDDTLGGGAVRTIGRYNARPIEGIPGSLSSKNLTELSATLDGDTTMEPAPDSGAEPRGVVRPTRPLRARIPRPAGVRPRHRDRRADFYTRVLGMRLETFGQGRIAFRFGDQKINLHEAGREFEPKAERPTPGALDLCFIGQEPLDAVVRRLETAGIPIEAGPVPRTGATGPIRSVYVRDPDGNLIEIAEPA